MIKPPRKPLTRGDWVEVLDAAGILATLDADGRLEGLPFMPEMAALCGRRLRVFRRADKTCVEGHGLRRLERTVLLDEARCDGAAHDGCQRNCLMFWKEAWLRPVRGPGQIAASTSPPAGSLPALRRLLDLPTRANERYLCQSTLLGPATTHIPKWDLLHLLTDLRNRQLSLVELWAIVVRTLVNLGRRILGLPELGVLTGQARGPVKGRLTLRPGEAVRIRAPEEIRNTLGPAGKTAGLSFEPEMAGYAGGVFEVDFRVERIILEETGEMARLKDTVALKGLTCAGSCVKNCPRANTLYWREAWLERAEPEALGIAGSAPRRSRSRPSERPARAATEAQRRAGEG